MNPARIFVVDDNLMNIELVSFLLRAEGFDVDSAQDATAAASRIPGFQPDLILMDIQLPDMDGLALTRQLKASPAAAHVPIVAFTAYAMKGDEQRMLQAGCDGYIAKPIEVATFVERVRGFLAEAQTRRR